MEEAERAVVMTRPEVLALSDPATADPAVAGQKAARLARLASAGFPVPDGVVIPAGRGGRSPDEALRLAEAALALLGEGPLAVRSSGVAEDLDGASYAGVYDTVLGVRGVEDLAAAIRRVAESADSTVVHAYSRAPGAGMAILIQHMVDADAAGVAFTVDPLTGSTEAVLVSAVTGLGEALVSGEATGETWRVTGSDARIEGASDAVLTAADAVAVAELARRVEAVAMTPQDIEWAVAAGRVYLLQARPMTALPPRVDWTPSTKGHWRRDFRLGEWIAAPLTPSFDTWFLPAFEAGFAETVRAYWGTGMRLPLHVTCNGWYFTNIGKATQTWRMLQRPVQTGKWLMAINSMGSRPHLGEKWMADPALRIYEQDLLPAYRSATSTRLSSSPSPRELVDYVDAIAATAGALLLPMAETLGFAAKAEYALVTFYGKRLRAAVGGSHQTLLQGVVPPAATPAHAVTDLEWSAPTLGELGDSRPVLDDERFTELRNARTDLEARCRAALADDGKHLAAFDRALDIAQRSLAIRERMAAEFTEGWPAMRQALLLLGEHLVAAGCIERSDDVFYLTREEVEAALEGNLSPQGAAVSQRHANRTEQARLTPPLWIGKKSFHFSLYEKALGRYRSGEIGDNHTLVGVPASPGVATGTVRVVRGVQDFDRVREGDILVAPITAPAWTPLFSRVRAVVTDGGSIFAHASLVAREYGLPAVVGTGSATSTLRDGDIVTVDGLRGIVDRH